MIERLRAHSGRFGSRALILSPSRELAIQTLKVVKEFGRGTDLKAVLLVGGDSLEEQFGSMTSNPDIVIATPGRFLHLKVEMGLDLSSIKYVVFDEADRLFEMGFAAQLTEILHALPPSRQTLLFSATLPASLVEFARAGLQDPSLVRLDPKSESEDPRAPVSPRNTRLLSSRQRNITWNTWRTCCSMPALQSRTFTVLWTSLPAGYKSKTSGEAKRTSWSSPTLQLEVSISPSWQTSSTLTFRPNPRSLFTVLVERPERVRRAGVTALSETLMRRISLTCNYSWPRSWSLAKTAAIRLSLRTWWWEL